MKKQIGESRQLKLDQTIYHQLGYGGLVAILSHANQWKVSSKHQQLKPGSILGNFHPHIWISIVSQLPKNSNFVIENPIYCKSQRPSREKRRLMQYLEQSETQETYPEITG